tara:strand:+ start:416 stop:892 length:477 start_codon:yes stop_codon:yes gene_type:complete
MDINGTVNAGELEFTVELDTDELWNEIESQVEEKAYDVAETAAREVCDNWESDVDYTQGATDLLESYNPGTGCNLARLFEEAVRGAVGVDDFLKDTVLEQVGEHAAGNVQSAGLGEDAVREIVRTEIRHFLATASSAVRDAHFAARSVVVGSDRLNQA